MVGRYAIFSANLFLITFIPSKTSVCLSSIKSSPEAKFINLQCVILFSQIDNLEESISTSLININSIIRCPVMKDEISPSGSTASRYSSSKGITSLLIS